MSDFLSKIENFLFEIIGLTLPGLFLLLLLLLPIFYLNFPTEQNKINDVLGHHAFISFVYFLHNSIKNLIHNRPSYIISGIVIASFIIGHLIKVVSIIFYDFFSSLFDGSINIGISNAYHRNLNKFLAFYQNKFQSNFLNSRIYKIYKKVVKPFAKPINRYVLAIFKFSGPSYYQENEKIKIISLKLIKQKTGDDFPDHWYSIYKISTVLVDQEVIKSKASTFLSKYNLYRSLSVIFLFSFFYYIVFFKATDGLIASDLRDSKKIIFAIIILLWYTFHHKYKRYWTLCGNEALMSLYYYLNKNKLAN